MIEDQTVYLVTVSYSGSGPRKHKRQTVVGTPEKGIEYCQRAYEYQLPDTLSEWERYTCEKYGYLDEQGSWPMRFEIVPYQVDIDVDHWDEDDGYRRY